MPKHFVSLCALPKTPIMQSFCVSEYLDTLKEKQRNGDVAITNPAPNQYTLEVSHTFKKTHVWTLQIKFVVHEFDVPTLIITDIVIDKALHLSFTYNENPKSLQYDWGELMQVNEVTVNDEAYYMLALAALQEEWAISLVYARANRKVITTRPMKNCLPSMATSSQHLVDAIQKKMYLRLKPSSK